MNILITGANGFIGSHLLNELSKTGRYSVKGLVRKTSNLFRLEGKNYNLVYGSINDPLDDIVKGNDIIIHQAGKSSDWGDYKDFYRANVKGTLNVVNSSFKNGVKRFIYFSSTVVYGFNNNIKTAENKKNNPFKNNYCITKTLAEEKVLKFKDKLELIIFRPSNVYGPYDTSFTYPIFEAINKGLLAFPDGGNTLTSPCFVKNLCHATLKAIETTKGLGEVYNISDDNDMLWKEYITLIKEELNKKSPQISIPSLPLYGASILLEKAFKLFNSKKPPVITPYRIAQVRKNYSFSIEKAKKLLNYNPLYTTKEGIRESAKWYYRYKDKIK